MLQKEGVPGSDTPLYRCEPPGVIASLFSLSLRAKRGNLEEQNPKSEILNNIK